MTTLFAEIVQFEDEDGNGAFDPRIDTAIKKYPLNNGLPGMPRYRDIVVSKHQGSVNGSVVHVLDSVTRDGVFGFEVAITSQKTSFDGHVMVPTAAKISFKVDNFPYAAGAKNLAVKMWLLTDSIADDWKLQQPGRHAHHHPFISGRGSKNGGFFSWNGTVIADGFSHDVKEHFEANTGNEDVVSRMLK